MEVHCFPCVGVLRMDDEWATLGWAVLPSRGHIEFPRRPALWTHEGSHGTVLFMQSEGNCMGTALVL